MRRTILLIPVLGLLLPSLVMAPAAGATATRIPTSGYFGPEDLIAWELLEERATPGAMYEFIETMTVHQHGDAYSEGFLYQTLHCRSWWRPC